MEERYTIKKPASIKRRKRVGCGNSSGHGKTSGRGHKGQKSRSGAHIRPGFEGGQMPIQRRIPKRGFNNKFSKEYQVVNLGQIAKLEGAEVNPALLVAAGLLKKEFGLIKILGTGELSRPVKVVADAFSETAKEKIKKAGGEAIIRESRKEQQTK